MQLYFLMLFFTHFAPDILPVLWAGKHVGCQSGGKLTCNQTTRTLEACEVGVVGVVVPTWKGMVRGFL